MLRGLFDPATYKGFRSRVYEARDRLMELAYKARQRGVQFVGNSCPGRSGTLLNFYGMTPDLMPYIPEQPTSLKLGLHLPGKHIPIVMNQRLIDEQPEHVLLLAWHIARPIAEQLRARGLTSTFIVPLPEVTVLDI